MSAVQDHLTLVRDAGGTVPGPGTTSRGWDDAPPAERKIKLVQIGLVRAIVPTKHIERGPVHNGGVRMAGGGGSSLQSVDLAPRHGGKVKAPKVADATDAVKASVDEDGIAKRHGDVTVAGRRRGSGIGRGQDWTPAFLGKGEGVEGVHPLRAVVATKDVHDPVEEGRGVKGSGRGWDSATSIRGELHVAPAAGGRKAQFLGLAFGDVVARVATANATSGTTRTWIAVVATVANAIGGRRPVQAKRPESSVVVVPKQRRPCCRAHRRG